MFVHAVNLVSIAQPKGPCKYIVYILWALRVSHRGTSGPRYIPRMLQVHGSFESNCVPTGQCNEGVALWAQG